MDLFDTALQVHVRTVYLTLLVIYEIKSFYATLAAGKLFQ
jgi:hypothetical protein